MRIRTVPRRAFTLTEWVVVVSVIIMFVCLFWPSIGNIRDGGGRRTSCQNNIRYIALALQNHEAQYGHLPGWTNRQDVRVMRALQASPDVTGYRQISWVFPLLPYLEKDNLYRLYSSPAPGDPAKLNESGVVAHAGVVPREYIRILVCPNDTLSLNNGTKMSYVANCGLRERQPGEVGVNPALAATGSDWGERTPSALFFNAVHGGVRGSIQTAADHDGASQTLLLSENMDAGRWSDDWEDRVGFCWVDVNDSPAQADVNLPTMSPSSGRIGENPGNLPRASSFHPGGFMVAYADSHVAFVNSNIDWSVYIRLFTPHGAAVRYRPYTTDEPPATPDIVTQETQQTELAEEF